MTVDARSWLHKIQVVSLGRDNPSRNVDANMTIAYFVEGLHHNGVDVFALYCLSSTYIVSNITFPFIITEDKTGCISLDFF